MRLGRSVANRAQHCVLAGENLCINGGITGLISGNTIHLLWIKNFCRLFFGRHVHRELRRDIGVQRHTDLVKSSALDGTHQLDPPLV